MAGWFYVTAPGSRSVGWMVEGWRVEGEREGGRGGGDTQVASTFNIISRPSIFRGRGRLQIIGPWAVFSETLSIRALYSTLA